MLVCGVSPEVALQPVPEPGEDDQEDAARGSDDEQGSKILNDVAQHGEREEVTAGRHRAD